MVVSQRAFTHQGMRDWKAHMFNKFSQLLAGLCQKNTASDISDWAFGFSQRLDNLARCLVVN